jgi:hypothetical protein
MDQKVVKRRLASDKRYVRPEKTVQDTMTADQIREKLEDYMRVDDIFRVPLNSHIRYFTIEEGKRGKPVRKFRLGGFLYRKDDEDRRYVILTNNNFTWTVQVENAEFYRKMNLNDLREKYEEIIEQMEKKLQKYKKRAEKLEDLLLQLESSKRKH